jgi:hypothetical protein
MVDLINFVPGNDYSFQLTVNHDIAGSSFESGIHTADNIVLASFAVVGATPTASGIINVSMGAADTALVLRDAYWFFDEIRSGLRRTVLAGNVEVYLK